jgi:hypothetical protein
MLDTVDAATAPALRSKGLALGADPLAAKLLSDRSNPRHRRGPLGAKFVSLIARSSAPRKIWLYGLTAIGDLAHPESGWCGPRWSEIILSGREPRQLG